MSQKIRCESCNKIIAEGRTPATITIECRHCGVRNDLGRRICDLPFTARLDYEKKVVHEDGTCIIPLEKKK